MQAAASTPASASAGRATRVLPGLIVALASAAQGSKAV